MAMDELQASFPIVFPSLGETQKQTQMHVEFGVELQLFHSTSTRPNRVCRILLGNMSTLCYRPELEKSENVASAI